MYVCIMNAMEKLMKEKSLISLTIHVCYLVPAQIHSLRDEIIYEITKSMINLKFMSMNKRKRITLKRRKQ